MTLEQAIRNLHPAMLTDQNGEKWDTDILLSDELNGIQATPGKFIADADAVVEMRDGYRHSIVYKVVTDEPKRAEVRRG